jgi:hypothetical protein
MHIHTRETELKEEEEEELKQHEEALKKQEKECNTMFFIKK